MRDDNPNTFYIVAIVGLRLTGEAFEPSTKTKTIHRFTFTKTSHSVFIEDHHASVYRVDAHEHIAFPTY